MENQENNKCKVCGANKYRCDEFCYDCSQYERDIEDLKKAERRKEYFNPSYSKN